MQSKQSFPERHNVSSLVNTMNQGKRTPPNRLTLGPRK